MVIVAERWNSTRFVVKIKTPDSAIVIPVRNVQVNERREMNHRWHFYSNVGCAGGCTPQSAAASKERCSRDKYVRRHRSRQRGRFRLLGAGESEIGRKLKQAHVRRTHAIAACTHLERNAGCLPERKASRLAGKQRTGGAVKEAAGTGRTRPDIAATASGDDAEPAQRCATERAPAVPAGRADAGRERVTPPDKSPANQHHAGGGRGQPYQQWRPVTSQMCRRRRDTCRRRRRPSGRPPVAPPSIKRREG
ncbi:hypothetical protein MRX96_047328 [Rhipicephalus microplus]